MLEGEKRCAMRQLVCKITAKISLYIRIGIDSSLDEQLEGAINHGRADAGTFDGSDLF
jgi:hypothetical protein